MVVDYASLSTRRENRPKKKESRFWQLTKRITIGIFLVTFIIIGIFGYLVWTQTHHFYNTKIVFVNESLDGKEMLINVALISPQGEQISVYAFDPSLETPVGSLGRYRLGAVYPLLKQEQYSADQRRTFYSFIFGFVIDDVIPLDVKALDTTENLQTALLTSWREGFISSRKALALWWLLNPLVKKHSLKAESVSSWDNWRQLQGPPASSRFEGCSLAVVNTTSTSGLAHAVTQILEQEGVEVIKVNSVEKAEETSQLLVNSEACQEMTAKIKEFHPVIVMESELPQSHYRAQSVLLIGQDLVTFNPQGEN